MDNRSRTGPPSAAHEVFVGDGEMAERMRAFDWSQTPVGPVENWPESLRTTVRIMLGSRYPMFTWWGTDLINLYNDAYVPVLGQRHPAALGQPARQVWTEIWPVVGPQAEVVMNEGRGTWNEELLLIMERNGYREETYFTFSYSPAFDETGQVAGVFCACTDDTGRVLGARRLRTLRALAALTAEAKSAEAVCEQAAQALAGNPHDLPFVLIYLLAPDGSRARLAGAAGLEAGGVASPAEIELNSDGDTGLQWPLDAVLQDGQGQPVNDLPAAFGPLPGGPWPEPSQSALVLPIAQSGQAQPAGFLIAGISPLRTLDDDYRGFLGLVAGHVGAAIADARAYEAERQRAEALAELDRAKTAFFSNVSHEFRTPLALLLGPLEDTLAGPTLAPADRERLETAHRNSLRLLKLVNSLLDFSRIEAGRIQAAYAPTDLAAFTADLASVFRSATERAGMHLVVECEPLPEPVYVDREMWEKIVLNLLSNAFKFTFEGEIRVSLQPEGRAVVLTVQDTGTGIPAAELPHVFERFHRVRDARARTHEGTGIGLALVQELVKLHGGTAAVESEEGRGSTFTVTLPFGRAHLPDDRIEAERTLTSTAVSGQHFVEEALRWLPTEAETLSLPGTDQAYPAAPHPELWRPATGKLAEADARPWVLLVDDNADMREYLRRLLREYWQVEAVADGQTALDVARKRVPDLVLADVMMPGLDGFQLLRALRVDPRTRTVPIILLSARAGEEARVEGLEAGADDYLVKPFSARELIAHVRAQLELARLRREMTEQEQAARLAVAELGERRRAEERLRQSAEQLQALSARLQAVREEERTRLAREIHDVLGQQLTGLKMELLQLRKSLPRETSEPVRMRAMLSLVDDTIHMVRRIATELRPAVLDDFGLVAATEWQLQEFEQRTGIRCRLISTFDDSQLERETATGIFRILQETLTNVARHARATDVEVRLEGDERGDFLTLQVRDNGRGISLAEMAGASSLGLLGMRERVQLLAGELDIYGEPGQGTTVIAKIPRHTTEATHL